MMRMWMRPGSQEILETVKEFEGVGELAKAVEVEQEVESAQGADKIKATVEKETEVEKKIAGIAPRCTNLQI